MKQVIVFGASGLAGSQIVAESLKAGHEVCAFIRKDTLSIDHPRLTEIQGDVYQAESVAAALQGREVVVCALGNRNYHDPTKVVYPALQVIVPAMIQQGITRLMAVNGSGMLNEDEHSLRRDQPNQLELLKYPRQDHFASFLFTIEQPIDWTIICPPRIKEGPADGAYLTRNAYFPEAGQSFITAGNLGHMIAREINQAHFIRKRVGIATKP